MHYVNLCRLVLLIWSWPLHKPRDLDPARHRIVTAMTKSCARSSARGIRRTVLISCSAQVSQRQAHRNWRAGWVWNPKKHPKTRIRYHKDTTKIPQRYHNQMDTTKIQSDEYQMNQMTLKNPWSSTSWRFQRPKVKAKVRGWIESRPRLREPLRVQIEHIHIHIYMYMYMYMYCRT